MQSSSDLCFGEGRFIGKINIDLIIFISFMTHRLVRLHVRDLGKIKWFNYVEPIVCFEIIILSV